MKKLILSALAAAALGACGSSSDSGTYGASMVQSAGPCAQRVGFYRTTFVQREGNCGAIPERFENSPSQPPAGPVMGCEGPGVGYSADNCTVTSDATCTTNGIKMRLNGRFTYSGDGTKGSGILQAELISGDAPCTSTYDVTVTKQ